MESSWRVLETFLEQCATEALGRGAREQPPGLEEQLRAFAQGQASDDERAHLAALLKEHPEWVSWLADQIKAHQRGATSSQHE